MHYMHILTSAHALTISTYALLPTPIKKIKNKEQNLHISDQKFYCRLCWYRWRNPYHQRALHAAMLDNTGARRINHSWINNWFFHLPGLLRPDHYEFFSIY